MKLLIEPSRKENIDFNGNGVILPLKDYAVESIVYFSLEEIKNICSLFEGEIFIKINKNLFNEDIDEVKNILIELDKLNVNGIFFYDLAILLLKEELKLKTDLVWSQTHMVNNFKTCNYYYSHGVKYALLGKEITLDEIKEIVNNSDIVCMVEVVSKPSIAFSRRKLLTNYYNDLQIKGNKELVIHERVSDNDYYLVEDDNGTCFFSNTVMNGTSIIRDLWECGVGYIIFREFGLEDIMNELILDTKYYIDNKCCNSDYIDKYRKLGDSTNFFFRKTIYRVKK